MAAAGVVDPGVVDPYAGVRRRVAQSLGPSGQQGGGWEAPLGTPSPSMGGPTPSAPFTPANPTPNGGGWEDPTGAPAPTMGPPTIGSSPSPNGGGWEGPPGTPSPTMGPPTIGSSPTEGIPPVPSISSSPTEGIPPPLSAPIGGVPGPTMSGLAGTTVPSTITSAQAATDVPDSPYTPPNPPPYVDPTTVPTTAPPTSSPQGAPAADPNAPPKSTGQPVGKTVIDPTTPPGAPTPAAPVPQDDRARVDALLAKYQSTDDPNYWYNLVQQHGGFDATGPAWLEDRIMRGDGAIGVRNGTVQKFQDTAKSGTGAPVAPPQAYTPPTGPTAPAVNTAFQDAIRQQIMDRLKTSGMPVDENAAGISGAVSAARDQATRAGEQERTALAERLYAQNGGGLNSGALTQQIQQSGERTAQTTSGLRANLIMQEYGRKQQELDQLLSMATASGDAESARQIQLYQAQLQAELQREGISADLAKYTAYLNQNAALSGLNG